MYQKFDAKIKKVEQKVLGTVSDKFDLKWEIMLERYIDEKLEDSHMKDFIRAEYLNLIIARKQFVKDSKKSMKEGQDSSSMSPSPLRKKGNEEGKQRNVNTPTRSEIMAVSTDSRT